MATNSVITLNRLRKHLRDGTLASPMVFLTLGQHIRAQFDDRRGVYGDQTLEKYGATLRLEFPNAFPSRQLAAILQTAVRFANVFTAEEIQNIEQRGISSDGYHVSVWHLRYLASACRDKASRKKWIDQCFHHKWSARQLHEHLKSTFAEPRSRGGRLLPTPDAGVRSIESAVKALERLFAHDSIDDQWKSLTRQEKSALKRRLARCRETLRKLEEAKQLPITRG